MTHTCFVCAWFGRKFSGVHLTYWFRKHCNKPSRHRGSYLLFQTTNTNRTWKENECMIIFVLNF